ncbi:MAG: triose-phosphate isomerase [Candidatus Njordarchaeia archaeon]
MFVETQSKEEKKLKINPPLFLVNFKAYSQAIGENAATLTEIIEEVAQSFPDITFAIAPQPSDIRLLRNIVDKVLIFGQHADPISPGAHTGHILIDALRDAGVSGLLINHSERQLDYESIKFLVKRSKELGLITCVCADTPENSGKMAKIKPHFVAFEPPELIGTGISVSKAKPDLLVESVKKILAEGGNEVIPVCGAGISKAEDVKRAIELGAKGILVASAIVKAEDPYSVIVGMAEAMSETT